MGKPAKSERIYKKRQTLRMVRAYNDAIAEFLAAGERFDPGALAAAVIAAATAHPSSDPKNVAGRAVETLHATAKLRRSTGP